MFWIHVTEFFTHIADAPYYVQLIGVAVSVVLLLGGHTGTRRGTLLFLADCLGVAAVTLVLNVAFFLLGIFLHIQVGSYMHFLLAIVLYALLRSRFNPPARVAMACVAFSTVTLLGAFGTMIGNMFERFFEDFDIAVTKYISSMAIVRSPSYFPSIRSPVLRSGGLTSPSTAPATSFRRCCASSTSSGGFTIMPSAGRCFRAI